jgi:hypothetical protein
MRPCKLLLAPVALIIVSLVSFGMIGCSSSTTPSNNNFQVQTDLTASQVSGTIATKGSGIQSETISRITISSVKLLISEIKLDQKSSGSEIKVKDKAAILSVDSSGSHLSSVTTIPSGTYNKISIKFHKLIDSERAAVVNDPAYSEFIGNERYSVIIHGTIVHADSTTEPFTFAGKLDETLKLDMADVDVSTDGMTIVSIQLDPSLIFKDKVHGVLLDPTDSTKQTFYDDALKLALNARKK